jgi:hypothetical protein
MPGFMKVIAPDGSETVTEMYKPADVRLLREAVGGDLELVPYFDTLPERPEQPCQVYCNDEGKLQGFRPNSVATRGWATVLIRDGHIDSLETLLQRDYLAGPIAIVWGDPEFMNNM